MHNLCHRWLDIIQSYLASLRRSTHHRTNFSNALRGRRCETIHVWHRCVSSGRRPFRRRLLNLASTGEARQGSHSSLSALSVNSSISCALSRRWWRRTSVIRCLLRVFFAPPDRSTPPSGQLAAYPQPIAAHPKRGYNQSQLDAQRSIEDDIKPSWSTRCGPHLLKKKRSPISSAACSGIAALAAQTAPKEPCEQRNSPLCRVGWHKRRRNKTVWHPLK